MNSVPSEHSHVSVAPKMSWSRAWLGLGLFALVAGTVYAGTLVNILGVWWNNPDYSHGLLLPFVVGFFLWLKRKRFGRLSARPADSGLIVIVVSQIIFVVGYLGAEFFLRRFSFLLLAAGMVLFLWGWRHLRESSFVFALFLLAIPLPTLVFNSFAFPLQLHASWLAEWLLGVSEIPVYREGNLLFLPKQVLNVTEACSGIRSLMSLGTLGMILAYFLPVAGWLRIAFVLSTIPVALVANAARVAGTGMLGEYFSEQASTGFYHLFEGWVVFLVAFVILFAESMVLRRWFGRESSKEQPA